MQKRTIKNILSEVKMFSTLEESELNALEKISHTYEYKEGASLFLKGEMSDALMLLIDGVVSIFKHDSKGNEIVIGYFNRYSLLAEAATLRHTPLPSSARFESDGAILKIDIEEFEKLFITHPKVSQAIIESLLEKMELLQQNIHFNIATNATDKILQFYEKNSSLSANLKQYEIASILGMTAETFSRNASKLVQEGKLLKSSTGYKIKEV